MFLDRTVRSFDHFGFGFVLPDLSSIISELPHSFRAQRLRPGRPSCCSDSPVDHF
jgi:hypothetical protein